MHQCKFSIQIATNYTNSHKPTTFSKEKKSIQNNNMNRPQNQATKANYNYRNGSKTTNPPGNRAEKNGSDNAPTSGGGSSNCSEIEEIHQAHLRNAGADKK